jgi:hypothetical protein
VANAVTYEARPDIQCIWMSNGLTSLFVSVLTLAASELAETDRQREFAAWFASHDQGWWGLGAVGGDISKLPWSLDTFAVDREFVLRVIHAAKTRTGWERLDTSRVRSGCSSALMSSGQWWRRLPSSTPPGQRPRSGATAVRRDWCYARSIGCTSMSTDACCVMISSRAEPGAAHARRTGRRAMDGIDRISGTGGFAEAAVVTPRRARERFVFDAD